MSVSTNGQPVASDPAQAATPLTDLAAGGAGLVVRIEEDDHAMLIRLKTMGMHEGRLVRVIRAGSRIIVSCGGTRIGLAAEVARHVLVAPTQR
ncbi:MAG: FeoA family protein [Phycisphaeraceae bacterium]